MSNYTISLLASGGVHQVEFAQDETTAYRAFFKLTEKRGKLASSYVCTIYRDREVIDRCAFPPKPIRPAQKSNLDATSAKKPIGSLRANICKVLKTLKLLN